ncbi:MAG: YdeI/OmpD-associated family protein [Pseudomonadota bacterium]
MPTFFKTASTFRSWLQQHASSERELLVGFYKKDSGRASITWPESVDEALCVGWIDGVRKGIDEISYQIRFTPRKASSIWSAVNIKRIEVLSAEGRMTPAGIAAFEKRSESKSRTYAYEQATEAMLTPAAEQQFKANTAAWQHFMAQPPGYRRQMLWWIVSAKQHATRDKRLAKLIEISQLGKRL